MKKIILIVVAVVVIIAAVFCVYSKMNKATLTNDGINGVVNFEKLGADTGYGIDIDQGEFPMDVKLEKGKLNIKITKGNDVIFEETNIEASKEVVANIPETGFYIVMLSGKNATGSMNYPVSESKNAPVIGDIVLEKDPVSEEIVKNTVEDYLKTAFPDAIESVKFTSVKTYNKEEAEKNELMKELKLNENDIVFEIDYELQIKEGYDDIMQFTAATGEIDGNWVKEKYNCGVARYNQDKDEYSITDFGTGF